MITIYQKTVKEHGVKRTHVLEEFRPDSWVCVENPSDEEIHHLIEKFSLDQGLLHDALDIHEVPRMEVEDGIEYLFTRLPLEESGRITTAPLLVAVAPEFFLTSSLRPLPFLEKFLGGRIEFSTAQKKKLFIQIFSEIISSYNFFLTDIGRKVRIAGVDLEGIDNRNIVQFVTFESILNDFLAGLIPTQSLLQNILSGRMMQLYEEDKDLVEDLFLGIGQLVERCKAVLKTIVNIREAYSAILTNNLNRVIKLLTALTIVLTIPTMIGSFYGMNIPLPFQSSPSVFWIILGLTFCASAGVLYIFLKKDWL